eukprot:6487504-Prymnesium_polylepis.1
MWGAKVYGIKNIDQLNQVATVDMFLRTMWTDPRLAFTKASDGGCFSNPRACTRVPRARVPERV